MLKGITVVLHERIENGKDAFNRPVYTENDVAIKNVLVAPTSEEEILDTLNLTGRKAVYTLAIPKGDQHQWENQDVTFFDERWHTIGMPVEGISILKRITSGVKLIQLDEGSVVASIAKIREDMKDDGETSDEQSEEAGMIEEVLETDSVDNSEENETE